MSLSDQSNSDRKRATELLGKLANEGADFTPGVAIELASMLCHIAGGDGRGTFAIVHDPAGDRV
jgi:hypothetical protein